MSQRVKTIILISIILIITLGVIVYYFNYKNIKFKPEKKQQSEQIKTNESAKEDQKDDSAQQPQTITASTLVGEVSMITEDSIEITKGDVKNSYVINQKTPVFSVEGEKIERKTIKDIKKNDNVSIMTNQADNSVLSIQIGKDAGSIF